MTLDTTEIHLTTRRLTLRVPTHRDAPAVAEVLGNFCVAQYLTPVPHPYSVSMAAQWLRGLPEMPTPERATFLMDLAGAGIIGCVALGDELGFWVAQPFWHQGFGTEAIVALLDWHFAGTDRQSVRSSAHAANRASLTVQKKLGFVRTGISQRFSVAQNRLIEHVETLLTRKAYEGRK